MASEARPLRVLVTRPAGEAADALCAALGAAGYEAFSLPLLELSALPEPTPVQRHMLQDLAHYQHIIFVSSNAVRFGMAWVYDYWPQLPVGINWYAIGDATANSLARYDIKAITRLWDLSKELKMLDSAPAIGDALWEHALRR